MHFLVALRISFLTWLSTVTLGSVLNLVALHVSGLSLALLPLSWEHRLLALLVLSAVVSFPGTVVLMLCLMGWKPQGEPTLLRFRIYAITCMLPCLGLGWYGLLLILGAWVTHLLATAPLLMLVAGCALWLLPRKRDLTWASGNPDAPQEFLPGPEQQAPPVKPHL
jgi:hypothetical protein